jgi:hypothetical protein
MYPYQVVVEIPLVLSRLPTRSFALCRVTPVYATSAIIIVLESANRGNSRERC